MSCLPESIVDPAETNPGRARYVEHFAFHNGVAFKGHRSRD
jgi:hypothetical protein